MSTNTSDKCYCLQIKVQAIGDVLLQGLRCPACIDALLEAKNELVRENNCLREELRKITCLEHLTKVQV